MNRHLWGLCVLMLAVGLCGNQAAGQAPTIPPAALTAANARPHLAEIQAFIQYYLEQLASDDPAAQTAAREALVRAARPTGITVPGPAYLDAYARALNDALVKLPDDASVRAQLNAAIATARVAEAADNYNLADAVIAFMGNDSMPVALWGIKAAEYILPHELRNPLYANDPKVLTAIQQTLESNPAGPIIDEAYETLRLRLIDRPGEAQPNMVQAVLPVVQQTLESRIEQMLQEPVESPMAEARATFFLTNPRVWPSQTAQQKLRTAQLINNLIHVAAQRAANNGRETLTLIPLIQEISKSLEVLGQNENNQAIQTAARTLSQIGDNTDPADIIRHAQAVHQALQAVPAFSQLEPAPELEPTSGTQAGTAGVVAGSTP